MPNYIVLNDKPIIHTKPGKTITLCVYCLEKKYSNEPPAIKRQIMSCPCCGLTRMCQEIELARLEKKPPKRKVKEPSIWVRFNIFKKQVVVK